MVHSRFTDERSHKLRSLAGLVSWTGNRAPSWHLSGESHLCMLGISVIICKKPGIWICRSAYLHDAVRDREWECRRPVAKCYCEDRSASIVAPTILSWRLGSQRSTPNNQIITYKSRHIYLLIWMTRTRPKQIQLLEVPMAPILIAHASSQNSGSSTSYSPLLAVSDFQLCDTMHTRILLSRPLYSHTGASVAAH